MNNNESGPHGPKLKEAIATFLESAGISRTQLARIIGLDASIFGHLIRGLRPYYPLRARLYMLTGSEVFAPKKAQEVEIYKRERENPPPCLAEYLKGKAISLPEFKQREGPIYKEPEIVIKQLVEREATMTERAKDPAIGKAMAEFKALNGLSNSQISKVVGIDKAEVTRAGQGIRPYAVLLARLFVLSGDTAFSPKSEREVEALKTEDANPPKSLTEYLQHKIVPDGYRHKKSEKPKPKPEPPQSDGSEAEVPQDITASQDFSNILSGTTDIERQAKGKVRFVITADNFLPLKGRVYNPEIADTKVMIQELRRRITVFAQLQDPKERIKVLRELGDEIDELYLVLEVCRDELPFKAAQSLADLRKRIGSYLK